MASTEAPSGFGPGVYRGEQQTTTATTDPQPSTAAETTAVAPTNGASVTNSAAAKNEVAPPYPLRNLAISIAYLPAHPVLAIAGSAPSMASFLHALLTPALQLIDSRMPEQWTSGGKKKSKPSTSEVKLYKWEDNRADQTWHIRRSTHPNVANPGTFTWTELEDALRVSHSEKEADYTPDVYDYVEVCKWGAQEGLEPSTTVEGFSNIDMRLVEMAHKLPAPLAPRAFAQLIVGAQTRDGGLIVVQSPVDISKVPPAMYSNGRNKKDGSSLQKRKATIIGSYVSIERARTTERGVIEWTMGTASDAKGALPMWLQSSQIGGAIAKDVGFVTQWLMKKRQTHSVGANAQMREA